MSLGGVSLGGFAALPYRRGLRASQRRLRALGAPRVMSRARCPSQHLHTMNLTLTLWLRQPNE